MAPQDEAVSPVIGVLLMVAIAVMLAGIVFLMVQVFTESTDNAPSIGFESDEVNDWIRVIRADPDIFWDNFQVTGCTSLEYPGGTAAVGSLPHAEVLANDKVVGCSGSVRIVYLPTNTVLYNGDFS